MRRISNWEQFQLNRLASAVATLVLLGGTPSAMAQQAVPDGAAKTDSERSLAMGEAAPAKPADALALDKVVITGSHIRNANVHSSAPITQVGRESLEGIGSISVGDALSRIPSISAGLSASSNNTSVGGDAANVGVSSISLRNLGTARTLVLVNGRRWVSGVSANTGYGVDLNSIPAAMIARVDVLTGGQSAIYGSDAIAGVINIITKTNFNGLELNALASDSANGGAGKKSFDLTYGRNFDAGNAWVSVGHSKQEALRSPDRPFSANELNFIDTNKDGIRESIAVRNGPAHIPGGALFFDKLALHGSGKPFNTNQPLLDSGFNRQGTTDYDNQFARRYLVAPYSPTYIASGLNVDLNDKSKLEFELNYTRTTSSVALEPAPVSAVADVFRVAQGGSTGIDVATSPYFVGSSAGAQLVAAMGANTSLDRVQTFRRVAELGDRTVSNRRETLRTAVSLSHDFSDTLSLKSSAVYGATTALQTNTGDFSIPNFRNALTIEADGKGGYRCANAQARIEGCVPVNPFGTTDSLAGKAGITGISPEAAKYLGISTGQSGEIKQLVVNSVLSGQLPFSIASNAPASFAAGLEFRREEAEEIPDAYRQKGLSRDLQVSAISGSFDVKEAFGEIEVPISKRLVLSAAGRFSDYSSVGKNFTHRYGFNAPVLDILRLRGSFSPRSVRAPNINDLYSNGVTNVAPTNTDVCNGVTAASTGNIAVNCRSIPAIANRIANKGSFTLVSSEANNTRLLLAGSPTLSEETARTVTLGGVLTPLPGLSLSADFYDIDIKNGITRMTPDALTKNCYSSASTSFDPTCGGILVRDVNDGPVLSLRSPLVNAASIKTRGIDLEVGYVGRGFNIGVYANYLNHYDVVDATGTSTPFAERPLYPKWRITTNASYNVTDRLNLFGQARFRSATKNFLTKNDFSDDLNQMKSVTYVDLRLNYKATESMSFYVGSNNVFNVQPDINVRDAAVGTNTEPGAYDVIGRQYFLGMKVKF
ncbi:TonB-dependent receptor domain-containing protein [Roseateles sp. PN1]|uniref:TonB-dependent receptor domain-containing protein n=1 Tax=Roseateles sp. PN1 TaxID=3137372 RepID=UPI003139AAFC